MEDNKVLDFIYCYLTTSYLILKIYDEILAIIEKENAIDASSEKNEKENK